MKNDLVLLVEKTAVKNNYVRKDIEKFLNMWAKLTYQLKEQVNPYKVGTYWNNDLFTDIDVYLVAGSSEFHERKNIIQPPKNGYIHKDIPVWNLRKMMWNIPKILKEFKEELKNDCKKNDAICAWINSTININI